MSRNLVVSRERRRFVFVAPLWVLPLMLPALCLMAVAWLFVATTRASIAVGVWAVRTVASGQAALREHRRGEAE